MKKDRLAAFGTGTGFSRLFSGLRQFAAKLLPRIRPVFADRRGGIMVEFAVALPVLIFILISLIEIRSGFIVKQRTIVAATTMSNIIAQLEEISPQDIAKLDTIALNMFYPYTPAELNVKVSLVQKMGAKLVFKWQQGSDSSIDPEEAEELVGSLLLEEETAVIAKISIVHKPVISGSIGRNIEMDSVNIVYPQHEIRFAHSTKRKETQVAVAGKASSDGLKLVALR